MRWIAVLALLAAVPARAGEPARVAVTGFGACAHPLLPEATRRLRAEAAKVAPAAVVPEADTARLTGMGQVSLEEVQRAIESGRIDFLNLNVARAEATLRQAMRDSEQLPLGPARWDAWVAARTNLARVLQYLDSQTATGAPLSKPKREATELFLEILRVKEDFVLNRAEFPPSTRDLLEQTRVLASALPTAKLTVKSARPGATVFIDGYASGRTPWQRPMRAGTYHVVVGDADKHSFVRTVVVTQDATVEVDEVREAALQARSGPCYESAAASVDEHERRRRDAAALLASALKVDRVLVVWLERSEGTDYVAAANVDARGIESHRGSERLVDGQLPGLTRLAGYVLTGKEQPSDAPLATATQAVSLAARPAAVDERLAQPAEEEPVAPVSSGGGFGWKRVTAVALGVVAVGLAGGAVYEHVQAGAATDALAALVIPGSNGAVRPEDVKRAQQLQVDADSASSMRLGLGAAAGVAALGAGGMFVWSLGAPGETGPAAGVAVAGRF